MERIKFIEKPNIDKEIFDSLNHIPKKWFKDKFGKFSDAQRHAMLNIRDRKNILVTAPTGSGKTLCAFGSILNYLIDLDEKGELENKVYAVYVSPLKALVRDVEINLKDPLEEMEKIAGKKIGVRVAMRTGDSTTKERQSMLKKCPHILVCTPETLAIVLTTKKFVEGFSALEYIIIDEIHALTNKRGVYLSLTLERLCNISIIEPVRIGLSATISPLEEIARFLVGEGRDCLIADVKLVKEIEIDLDFPGADILDAESLGSQKSFYYMLDKIIGEHKTVLIFTNTRAGTERIVHYLDVHFPGKYAGKIGAHHGSMSKETRFEVEDKLRKGELKVVVSSTSLELGLDIGSIDYVVMLNSPKSVSRALQRIGRAGHKLHDNPKGEFIVLSRDEMVECGVMMKEMVEKKIDKTCIPKNALDVLAQQIYGMAITRIWGVEEMLATIRLSYCYSKLSKDDFFSVVSYLAGDYALEHRHVYAKIWYNALTKQIGKKGMMARVMYMTNIGTIPSESYINVVVQFPAGRRGQNVGKIDEGFLERMKRGDVFVLGGLKYQFLYTRGMKAYVRADVSRNPTIPSWFSEMLPLSFDLGRDIGCFRGLVKERLDNREKCLKFIQDYLYCRSEVASEIYNYFKEQEGFSEIPTDKLVVVEKFKEEKEYLVFHTLYGRRVNDGLARAYAYAAARLRHRDVEMGISDNGFYIAGEKLDEGKILKWVRAKDLRAILKEAVEKTDVLKRRFRHCAARSLMILRSYKGREKSVGKQQVHSEFLYRAVKKISNEFPILQEARREVMEDLMDVANAERVLSWIESGDVKVMVVRIPLVSPFGLELYSRGRMDLIKIEDKVEFLKRMHELHLKAIKNK